MDISNHFLNSFVSPVFRFLTEWGQNSRFPQFRDALMENATLGFTSLGLVIGGFVLALVFEKKFGWLLILAGLGLLFHIFGFF